MEIEPELYLISGMADRRNQVGGGNVTRHMKRLILSLLILTMSMIACGQGSIGGYGMGGGGGAGPGGETMVSRKDKKSSDTNSEYPPVPWVSQTMIATAGVGCEWKVSAKAGDLLVAEAESEVFDPSIKLVDDRGKTLAENDDRKEGVQTPLILYRFAKDLNAKILVNSFRSSSGGKFIFRHYLFKTVTAESGSSELVVPTNLDAVRKGVVGSLLHFRAKKGQSYSISNIQTWEAERGWVSTNVSGILFGPKGVRSLDLVELKNGTDWQNWVRTFKALEDGDFFFQLSHYQGGEKIRVSYNPMVLVTTSKVGATTISLPAHASGLVAFAVDANDVVHTSVQGPGESTTIVEGPEVADDFLGLPPGLRDDGYWGIDDRFTWFASRPNAQDRTRIFYGTGDATVILSNHSDRAAKFTITNSMGTPVLASGAPISSNLAIGDSKIYTYESTKNEMMRLRAVAEAFRLKIEIIDYLGSVRNTLLDPLNNKPGDDLFFPNKEKFIFRVSCLGNGGSGAYLVRHDPIPLIPSRMSAKTELKLDGQNFGIYELDLPAKRVAVQIAYRGQLPNVMLLSESGQVINRRFYQFDDYTLSVFAIEKPGKYRLWIRGGASDVQFKVTEFKPPTIDD